MKKPFCYGLLMLLALCLCSCKGEEPEWNGYHGTLDEYEYCHTDERDRAWEEDILYMADMFLSEHPRLSNSNFMITVAKDYSGNAEYDYNNSLFNQSTRDQFINEINLLIKSIPELHDAEIRYESMRICAILEDAHSGVNVEFEDVLPICFESIGDERESQICVVRTPEEYRHLLGGQLVAVNDIPIEEVAAKMAVYIPHENDYWPLHKMVRTYDALMPFDASLLTQKVALHMAGVLDIDADGAILTFEIGNEMIHKTIPFISASAYVKLEMIHHDMVSAKSMRFQYDNNYWYIVGHHEGNPYIYVRFRRMIEDYPINQFLTQISTELRDSEQPAKLIIDFRDNTGGTNFESAMNSFANAVNRQKTNGVFILINGGCFSAGVQVPYVLSEMIEGAKLVGSPTGQFVNSFGSPFVYETPNHDMQIYVANDYLYLAPERDEDAVYPDFTVYQTWEDYQSNIDTVLEYVLAIE